VSNSLRSLLSCATTSLGKQTQREYYFEFKLKPQVKERARAGVRKSSEGKISSFMHTPEKTRRYEERIGIMAKIQHNGIPILGPLIANINFYFEKDPDGDLDNYVKAILDGMQQGKVFKNDKQIRGINAHVIYFDELDEDDERIERSEVMLSPRRSIMSVIASEQPKPKTSLFSKPL
jgi:Holliday junction resolvase RusA-like endonuclease